MRIGAGGVSRHLDLPRGSRDILVCLGGPVGSQSVRESRDIFIDLGGPVVSYLVQGVPWYLIGPRGPERTSLIQGGPRYLKQLTHGINAGRSPLSVQHRTNALLLVEEHRDRQLQVKKVGAVRGSRGVLAAEFSLVGQRLLLRLSPRLLFFIRNECLFHKLQCKHARIFYFTLRENQGEKERGTRFSNTRVVAHIHARGRRDLAQSRPCWSNQRYILHVSIVQTMFEL